MRTLYILWIRQIKKYFRSRWRIVGAIGQPVLYLLALGYGLGAVFAKAGNGNYLQFLVPGIIVQTILFASIFWGINIIFDRQFGFLKETMVAPAKRLTVFFGSILGGATTTFMQGLLVLILASFLGFRPYSIPMIFVAIVMMALLAIAITSLGAALGSIIDDMPGFQAVNNFIIFPLYFLSSALYPINTAPRALQIIAELNPLSYAVDAMRTTLINQSHFGLPIDFTVLGVTIVVLISVGVYCYNKIEA